MTWLFQRSGYVRNVERIEWVCPSCRGAGSHLDRETGESSRCNACDGEGIRIHLREIKSTEELPC